jgi:hypothetical protein
VGLFNITYNALLSGITQGYGEIQYGMPDQIFLEKLQVSAKYFAARKTALQVSQLRELLIKPDGTRMAWSEFKKAAKPIVGNYNKTWLKTEYDTTIRVARAARQWQDFERTADLFPNLEYRQTVSATPRPEHLRYVGIIRPITDSFWDYHTPPISWGCKCSLKNVDKPQTEVPLDINTTDPVEPALQNNAARTGQLFDIKKTAYFENTQDISDDQLDEELNNILT